MRARVVAHARHDWFRANFPKVFFSLPVALFSIEGVADTWVRIEHASFRDQGVRAVQFDASVGEAYRHELQKQKKSRRG